MDTVVGPSLFPAYADLDLEVPAISVRYIFLADSLFLILTFISLPVLWDLLYSNAENFWRSLLCSSFLKELHMIFATDLSIL